MADKPTLKEQMERIYGQMSPDEIPWNMEGLPQVMLELLEGGRIEPCRAIDLGCGAGNHAVALARRGFDVTGVDLSERAVDLARQRVREQGVSCRFVAADLLGDTAELGTGFELAYEWEVLHHILPGDRETYVRNVQGLLAEGGMYLSVCFSELSPQFGGRGKLRRTPLDTELYFSSEEELRTLFEPLFHIHELGTLEIPGKRGSHVAARAFMTRRL